MQTAVDNYYLASSRAAGQDLINFFAGSLKWPISTSALQKVSAFIKRSNIVYYYAENFSPLNNVCIKGDIYNLYITIEIRYYHFFETEKECENAIKNQV